MDDAKLPTLPTDDPYTNEWYRKQFARLNHLMTVLHVEVVERVQAYEHQCNALRKEVNEMNKARQQDAAKIGELQDLLDQQRIRLDKASDFVRSMRKDKEAAA